MRLLDMKCLQHSSAQSRYQQILTATRRRMPGGVHAVIRLHGDVAAMYRYFIVL